HTGKRADRRRYRGRHQKLEQAMRAPTIAFGVAQLGPEPDARRRRGKGRVNRSASTGSLPIFAELTHAFFVDGAQTRPEKLEPRWRGLLGATSRRGFTPKQYRTHRGQRQAAQGLEITEHHGLAE